MLKYESEVNVHIFVLTRGKYFEFWPGNQKATFKILSEMKNTAPPGWYLKVLSEVLREKTINQDNADIITCPESRYFHLPRI